MNKQEFITSLREKLSGLPQREVEERLAFYREMIDDRIEEGVCEEEAVRDIGSVDEIVSHIVSEIPLSSIVKNKMKPERRLRAREIVLLAVGSPVWLSLLVAALAVIAGLYVSVWSIIISLWAVFVSLVACSLGGVAACVALCVVGNALTGIFMLGAGISCAGVSIFAFFGCKAATKGLLLLTKKAVLGVKNRFVKREEENG